MTQEPKVDAAICQAAAYAALARSNGDEDREAYWTERVVRLSDAREAMQAQRENHERLLRAAVREALEQPGSDWLVGSLRASPGAVQSVIDDEVCKHRGTFDVLKGSPDHSGRLSESIARLERRA